MVRKKIETTLKRLKSKIDIIKKLWTKLKYETKT